MTVYIQTFGGNNTGRRKARSVRGWTSPSPRDLAVVEQAKQAAERKQAKETQRQLNIVHHEEWLYANARVLPATEQLGFLADQGASPSLTTKIMDQIAREV